MSKWFLLLNDKWKILRWLTVKIKNYFYVTLDDMCTITWNKFLFKKKNKAFVKTGISKSLYPIQVTYDHLNSKASRSRMWTSQLLSKLDYESPRKSSSFGITCWFLLVLAIKLVRKEGIGKVLCFTFFSLIFSF